MVLFFIEAPKPRYESSQFKIVSSLFYRATNFFLNFFFKNKINWFAFSQFNCSFFCKNSRKGLDKEAKFGMNLSL